MDKAELSFKHKAFLIATSVVPPVGLVAAIVLLWNKAVSPRDLAILACFYVAIGLGLSLGFHRLLTHRSFKTHPKVRFALGALGTMGAHGPPLIWVAHHRRHHQNADREGDPHSPHLHAGEGLWATFRGLWYAHSGWRFNMDAASNPIRYAPDVLRDRGLMWLSRHYIAVTLAGIVLPGLVGFALSGTAAGAATGALWGGLVRIFIGHHVVYSVNSLGHFIGPRRFETRDHSRNLALLALPTFGDSWHNNHHAFPAAAHHGMRWWELDPAAWLLKLMERLGLAWDINRVSRQRQADRVAEGSRAQDPVIDMGRRVMPAARRSGTTAGTAADVDTRQPAAPAGR
jgi:stearoyl-CoA desaturase (delta-9 desaturase)